MTGRGLPVASGKAVVAALERAGWARARSTSSSHIKLRHPDRPGHVTVPVHGNRDLPPGTLKGILDQAGLTADELKELL